MLEKLHISMLIKMCEVPAVNVNFFHLANSIIVIVNRAIWHGFRMNSPFLVDIL